MKKSRFLGYALTLAAMMVVGGAMGQATLNPADYSRIDADPLAANKSYVTVGKKVDFFVLPDGAFSIGYVSADNSNISKGITWTWTIDKGANLPTASPWTSAPANGDTKPETANYVAITAGNSADIATVTVQENSGISGFAGCNADPKTFFIHIFPAPTVSLAATPTITNCGPYTLKTTDLVFNIEASDKVNLKWHKEVDEILYDASTGSLKQKGTPGASSVALNFTGSDLTDGTLTWKLAPGSTTYTAKDATSGVPKNGTFTLTAGGTLPVVSGNKVGTMYRYYLSYDDKDGVNDFISRKSDYVDLTIAKKAITPDNCTRYAAVDATTKIQEVIIYVVNKPATGPVYHIANSKYN